jgi:hypothetical protein
MLAQLLSSKPKSRLVNLFLAHPGRSFSFTELRVTTGVSSDLLGDTLKELSKMGFLLTHHKEKNKYYQIDKHFVLYPELIALLRKIKKLPADILAQEAAKVGDKFVALTGVFAAKPRVESDLLFVGKVSQRKLDRFLQLAERFAERQVNYTVLTVNEYDYRKIMNDRFLKSVLENEPVIVIDRLKKKKLAKVGHRR